MGSVWCALSTVRTAANSDPNGGVGGDEDRLTGLPGILSDCSTTFTEPSSDANPNDIGPSGKEKDHQLYERLMTKQCNS